MRKVSKKKNYTKPIIITVSTFLVIALGIWGIIYLTTERVTARTISNYVTLGQYLGIEFEPLSTEVTDEDIEERIRQTLAGHSERIEVTDRAVQDGDFVLIDFAGFHDGVQFEGGTAEEFELHIGSGQFIPGFEEQIIGHNIGDEFNVYVTFPEEYHAPDLAGEDVIFEINLRGITEAVEPELTAEFVSENFDGLTIAEFRDQIFLDLQTEKEQAAEDDKTSAIWTQIMENSTIHRLPQSELEAAILRELDEQAQFAQWFGMDLPTLAAEWFNMSYADFLEFEIRPRAENAVSRDLVVRAIAFAEGISISNAEIDAGAERFAEEFGFDSAAEFIEINGRDTIRLQLMVEKVIELIKANAVAV